MAHLLFWLSALALVHVYAGYEGGLRLAARIRRPMRPAAPLPETAPPSLSLLLTVHDEAARIEARLEDLLAQDYPPHQVEIVVASDGSRDQTAALVQAFAARHPDRRIALVPLPEQGGKSAAQNAALPHLSGEVVVLTDARTRFAPGFLAAIAAPYADAKVGCVGGQVLFPGDGSAVARGQGRYWRSEQAIRALESRFGILAVASGQAMSFRRRLFRPLPLHVGDDCIIPLDVAAAGYEVRHQPAAVAFDVNETRPAREFRARARMTARNWQGTWRHPALLLPWRHPGYALALWSHKVMRWLSPLFLLGLGGGALALAGRPFYGVCLGLLLAGVVLAGLGALGRGRTGLFWRGAGLAYAFLLAQAGFSWGLILVAGRQRILAYRNRPVGGSYTGQPLK